MTSVRTLLGDIGGTNARFAVLDGGLIGPIEHLAVSSHSSALDTIGDFLNGAGGRVDAAVLGVAGPVQDGRCVVINSQWVVDADELKTKFGLKSARIVNDFEAIAWALPRLRAADVVFLAGGKAIPDDPMAVLGPGTGLGMAGVVRHGDSATVIATEGGHTTLPGTTPREDAVIAALRGRFGHASAERALSGPGLENLYAVVAAIERAEAPIRSAAEITARALEGSCTTCVAALDMFCALLGTVAGNLALTFRARGGIYITGGIAPRIADYLPKSEFHARFVAKGRFREYLESIPVTIIVNPDAAFLGLGWLAQLGSR
jgi:glucokinase